MVSLTFSKSIVARLKESMETAFRLSNIRLYRLAQALLWFNDGMSIRDISRLMGVCNRTIVNWLKTFMYKGIGWLIGQHYLGRGRKSKLTKNQQKQLVDLIKKGPEANGFHCGIWNTAMIAELIWLKFEVRYNQNYLSSLLKKLGFSYQKACFVTDIIHLK